MCVYCDVLWVGPKQCLSNVEFRGWVQKRVCVS